MNRAVGTVLALLWVVAMAALVHRDVLPFWTAQEPPSQLIPDGDYQVGVFNDRGRRVGATWVTAAVTPSLTTVRSTTILDLGAMAGFLPIGGSLSLSTDLTYKKDGTLDGFISQLESGGFEARVDVQRYVNDYACEIKIGSMTKTIAFDARLSSCLGETLRPFTHLRGLHVGQSWQIRLLDPLALIQDGAVRFTLQLAKVTAREAIEHNGGRTECFRIETQGAVAWADDTGRVLKQDVQVPLLGKFVLLDELFDHQAQAAAKTRGIADSDRKKRKDGR